MPTDVERFADVLRLLAAHRIVPGVVRVGDIQVAVTGVRPDLPAAAAHEGREPVLSDAEREAQKREAKLVHLRKRSKAQFGHVKPDDVLLALDGVL